MKAALFTAFATAAFAQLPAPFSLTADGVIAAAQAKWQCNVPSFTAFTQLQAAAVAARATSPAPGARVAAAADVMLSGLSQTAYTTGNAAVNAASGVIYTDSTCLVNAVLSMAAAPHRAVLPVDTPTVPAYFSGEGRGYMWPLVPRSPGMATFFSQLAAGTAHSQMWAGIADAANTLPGDVLATTLPLGPSDIGFAGVILGNPVVVAAGVPIAAGGNVPGAAAAAGPYTIVDVPVLSSVPAGWTAAVNDTRLFRIPASGAPAPLQGVGAGTVRLLVDAAGQTTGIDLVNGGGPASALSPRFPSLIGLGRPLPPSAALAQPLIASASFCDALQNQSLNMVIAVPPATSSAPAFAYVLSPSGAALREFAFPSPYSASLAASVTIACADVMPSLPGAEIIAFADDTPSLSYGSVVAVNALTGASQTLVTAPFTGPARVAAADVDGDGFADLLLAPSVAVTGGAPQGGGSLYLYLYDPSIDGFPSAPTTSIATGWLNGVDVSAAPLLQLSSPPLPLSSPFISSAVATAAAGGANPNASIILTVPHGSSVSPALQAWVWSPATSSLIPAPGRATLALSSSAYAAGGARVAALGATWIDGFAAIGSASSSSSTISYADVNAWTLEALAAPPAVIPGPHVLVSGGTLWPAPLAPSANTCNGYSTLSIGPTAGVFFVGTGGVQGAGMWMHTASRTWASIGFNVTSPSGGFGSALSGSAVGAVTTIFPALAPANSYASTYSITTLTASLGDLLYDWNTWPRNDSTAWAYISSAMAYPVNSTTGGPALPLSGPSSTLGIWQSAAPSTWATAPTPSYTTCSQPYGQPAMLFPPPLPTNSSASSPALRSTAAWRRERQIATAYYHSYMGLLYQHVHVPGYVPSNRGSNNFNYVSAARWTPGLDCSDFSSYVSNWANGLRLQTNVGGQDTVGQAILFQGTMSSAGVPDALPVPGHFPIASLAYAAVVATAPMPYDELISVLKPGDFIAISGGGPSQPPTHVVMYLGKRGLGAGVGVGSDYPLILDSTDTQFAPDQNGCLAPPGPHLREFRPGQWYARSWSSVHRWFQDDDDIASFWGGNAAAIDPVTRVALAPPPALPVNNFKCIPGATPGRACVAQLPASYDPRGTPCYPGSSAAVLAQGSCSASYAFAAASLLSTNLCLAGGSLSAAGETVFAQISPAYTMSVATALGGVARPCAGGNAMRNVLQPLAAWQAYAYQAGAAASSSSQPGASAAPLPLTTCSLAPGVAPGSTASAGSIIPCATGCAPYAWPACQGVPPFSAGGGPNASAAALAWEAAHPLQCPVLPGAAGVAAAGTAGLLSCFSPPNATVGAGGTITATLPSPPAIDATSAAAAATFALFNASATYLPVSGGALTSNPALLSWSAADIATVKSFTVGAGSVVVHMSACPAWRAWMAGCKPGSAYSSALGLCTSPTPLPGFAFAMPANAFVAAPNASLPRAAYGGPSCIPGTWGHTALIVGYGSAPVGGGDAFILQNSWGASWGDGGYFYLSTAAAGSGSAPNGGVGLSYPGTLILTPTPATLASFNGSLPAPGSAAASPAVFAAPAVAQTLAAFIGSNYSAPIPGSNSSGSGGSTGGGGGGSNGLTPDASSNATGGAAGFALASEFINLLNLATSAAAATALTSGYASPQGTNGSLVLSAVNYIAATPVQNGLSVALNVTAALLPTPLVLPLTVSGAALPQASVISYAVTGSMLVPESGGAPALSSLFVASIVRLPASPTPAPTPDPWYRDYEQAKDAAIGLGVLLGLLLLAGAYFVWQVTAERRRQRSFERAKAAAAASEASSSAVAASAPPSPASHALLLTPTSHGRGHIPVQGHHAKAHHGAAGSAAGGVVPVGAVATDNGGFFYTNPNPKSTARSPAGISV